jgi:hypothetical protein
MSSWAELHKAREEAAIKAEAISREGNTPQAMLLYVQAAELEHQALAAIDPLKIRTKAITAVSAVALWYKAAAYERAEQLAYSVLADPSIPAFARKDLRDLVQAIWTESSKQAANVGFLPGQVLVSVKGGEVITGGAPLDLIVEKVQTIQAMFYRTVEFIKDLPLRSRGPAPRDIQEACRPWLFQAAPGSYQFAVAIQEPEQLDFFSKQLGPELVAQQFFNILKATASSDPQQLEAVVPKAEYRKTFLKLSRNLAPTGKNFESIEFRTPAGGAPISLTTEARTVINQALKRSQPVTAESADATAEEHVGTLRAVDLEKDWLDVLIAGHALHVVGLEDAMDDIIGPMVNKTVKVSVVRTAKGVIRFRDIELDE